MINHLSLKHGWFYHYRVHEPKTEQLCPPKLRGYLNKMLEKGACPQQPFDEGPRSSALRFPINASIQEVEHPVIQLAAAGLANPEFRTAHSNVQIFMLKHDTHSVAVEVPIWMESAELGEHAQHFAEEGPLSGHIDVLRIEPDNKVWVWDYKPNAHREKWAATQVYYYAQMLSKRTALPLEHFRCGWFDDKKAYVFDPNHVR
jgi:hypothetical protein